MSVKASLLPLFKKATPTTAYFGTDGIMRFQNGCNKVVFKLRVVQFWSEIILVIRMELALHARPILNSRV